jgi:HEAT repeat protein
LFMASYEDALPAHLSFDELCRRFTDLAPKLRRAERLHAIGGDNRRKGVHLLVECGEKNAELAEFIFSHLVELFHDPDPDVREAAEYGIYRLGDHFFRRLLTKLKECDVDDIGPLTHLTRALAHFHYQTVAKELWPSANRHLWSLLDHESPMVRGAAAVTMAELGETSAHFIERLKSMSRSPRAEERRGALRGLKQSCENSPGVADELRPVFLRALGEHDPETRDTIEWALRNDLLGVLPNLMKRLNDTDPKVRAHVLGTLSRSDDDVPKALKRQIAERCADSLTDEDKEVREAAAFALTFYLYSDDKSRGSESWLGRFVEGVKNLRSLVQPVYEALNETAVDRLIVMCEAVDDDERSAALHALWSIGRRLGERRFPRGAEAISGNLTHRNDEVRKWAYNAHRFFEVETSQVVAVLIRGIDDSSCDVAGTSVKALMDLAAEKVDVSRAIPALCRVLDRRECDRAQAVYLPFETACEILAMFPREKVECAIAPLERSLTSVAPKVVGAAAVALSKIRGTVDDALPRLKELLDEDEMLAESFCDVLYHIGPAASPLAKEVVAILAQPNWDAQWAAADALGEIASPESTCISALIEALQHPSGVVRGAAVRALSKIGKATVPLLIQTLRGGDDELKEMAADALGVIGEDAREAVDDLKRLLNSAEEGVRDWAAIALGKIARSQEALPGLMTILRLREGASVRARAMESLGNIGPAARAALPLIEAALRDSDETVRSAAQDAISRLVG